MYQLQQLSLERHTGFTHTQCLRAFIPSRMEIHYDNFSLINWTTRLNTLLIDWTKLKFGKCHNVSLLIQKFLVGWGGRVLEEGTRMRGCSGVGVRCAWEPWGKGNAFTWVKMSHTLVQCCLFCSQKKTLTFVIKRVAWKHKESQWQLGEQNMNLLPPIPFLLHLYFL